MKRAAGQHFLCLISASNWKRLEERSKGQHFVQTQNRFGRDGQDEGESDERWRRIGRIIRVLGSACCCRRNRVVLPEVERFSVWDRRRKWRPIPWQTAFEADGRTNRRTKRKQRIDTRMFLTRSRVKCLGRATNSGPLCFDRMSACTSFRAHFDCSSKWKRALAIIRKMPVIHFRNAIKSAVWSQGSRAAEKVKNGEDEHVKPLHVGWGPAKHFKSMRSQEKWRKKKKKKRTAMKHDERQSATNSKCFRIREEDKKIDREAKQGRRKRGKQEEECVNTKSWKVRKKKKRVKTFWDERSD